ncbi:MAG TPA: helix-turn-helix domain-containing protein [Bryobacteraceae bacterium]|nr:helix-turn-helix domain-containing protein [Bryobacteraceae bacterium]
MPLLNRVKTMLDVTKTNLEPLIDAVAERLAGRLRSLLAATRSIPKRLLSVEEAAVYLGRSKSAIHALVEQGKVPVVRIDRRRFFDRADLDRCIERHKRHAR